MKNVGLLFYILILSLAAMLFLMGCTQPNDNGLQQNPGENGRFGPGNMNNSGFGPRGNFSGMRNGSGFRGNFSGMRNGTGAPGGSFGRNGTFGNLTDEQRTQLEQQRVAEIASACNGKAEGDSCTITSPRGAREGTCKNQNYQLVCQIPFPSDRPSMPPQ